MYYFKEHFHEITSFSSKNKYALRKTDGVSSFLFIQLIVIPSSKVSRNLNKRFVDGGKLPTINK